VVEDQVERLRVTIEEVERRLAVQRILRRREHQRIVNAMHLAAAAKSVATERSEGGRRGTGRSPAGEAEPTAGADSVCACIPQQQSSPDARTLVR
jgi:hypothetical protein